jgi:hypothetical protein
VAEVVGVNVLLADGLGDGVCVRVAEALGEGVIVAVGGKNTGQGIR